MVNNKGDIQDEISRLGYADAVAVKYVLTPPLREQEDIEPIWYNIKTGNI
ncbi:MAG: hypothetical protein KBE73_03295 [Fusobacteriaceae bacterium]|nr:hypothetical protein [Fusobacteriaceae bacterium]MBP6322442.1 hypothetical protein [Fusobacteriaceae bacterium]MBP9510143.1 hypothetical protein [Fusobacteriaceae bacterium]